MFKASNAKAFSPTNYYGHEALGSSSPMLKLNLALVESKKDYMYCTLYSEALK
jgi:hypothetical protein